jgi:2'-5' RNA ligase
VPRSALIVAVPEAESLVSEWRLRYDNASLGIPAHVTLLFPFVPARELDEALLGELRDFFSPRPSFGFTLRGTKRFEDQGILWLAPEPDDPFRELTLAIFERWPGYPPYEGMHDTVIPHLTVGRGEPKLLDEMAEAITPGLPIEAEVRDVVLLEEDEREHWHPRDRFALRGGRGLRRD